MRLLQAQAEQQGNVFCSGILDIMPDGYGFLRQETLLPSPPIFMFLNRKSAALVSALATLL